MTYAAPEPTFLGETWEAEDERHVAQGGTADDLTENVNNDGSTSAREQETRSAHRPARSARSDTVDDQEQRLDVYGRGVASISF